MIMSNVICFAGQARSGKDTSANYLKDNLLKSWNRGSFALEVKKTLCDLKDVDLDFIEKFKVDPTPPENWQMPVRNALKFIGDGCRDIDPNIWVNKCYRKNPMPLIISDGRYNTELKRVKEMGGVNIIVWRPGWENDDPHKSESEVKVLVDFCKKNLFFGSVQNHLVTNRYIENMPSNIYDVDYFLQNDGTEEELYERINNELFPFLVSKFGEELCS